MISPSYLILEVKGHDTDQSKTKKAALTEQTEASNNQEGLESGGTAYLTILLTCQKRFIKRSIRLTLFRH